jgi:hypothetical protein
MAVLAVVVQETTLQLELTMVVRLLHQVKEMLVA